MPFRARLTLAYTGFFALALLLLGCGIYFSVRQALLAGVQRDLWAATRQVRAIFNAGGLEPVRTPTGELDPYLRSEFIQIFNNPNLGAQVFDRNGRLLNSTPNLDGHNLPLAPEALTLGAESVGTGLTTTHEIDGINLVSLVTPLVLQSNNRVVGYLQVWRPLRDVETTLRMLTGILLGGGAIALLMTAAGTALLSRRALS
ncbi:MAG: sensor histidine kinase, partial [Chloroflexaceae bacterium]